MAPLNSKQMSHNQSFWSVFFFDTDLLIVALAENDPGNSTDLNERPYFKKFLEFLQRECHITRPFYVAENTIKLRTFNGNERNKIFECMFNNQNLIDLFPRMEERLEVCVFSPCRHIDPHRGPQGARRAEERVHAPGLPAFRWLDQVPLGPRARCRRSS